MNNEPQPRLLVVLGTRAQLIKMAPVIKSLQEKQVPFSFLWTGQHQVTIPSLITEFELNPPDENWHSGPEITSIISLIAWFFATGRTGWNQLKKWSPDSVVVVHGDTISTLLAAIIAKLRGMKVAHVEAGLRSFNFLHPFPEEITRLMVFALSDISYCPGSESCENMKFWHSNVVNTHFNTLVDTVAAHNYHAKKTNDFVIVSLHRYENIFNHQRLRWIVKQLLTISQTYPLAMILHPATKNQLIRFGYYDVLNNQPGIIFLPRITFSPFLKLVANSRFVITDGGSNQEECYYLGKPCLIMRKTTERGEGLNHNAYLSKYQDERVQYFVKNYQLFQKEALKVTDSPSEIISKHLKKTLSALT